MQHEGRTTLPAKPSPHKHGFLREMRRNYPYYLLALPAVVIVFLLSYLPLHGLIIAFKDYNFVDGIFGSPWVTPWYKNFMFYFKSVYFGQTTFNTLWINACYLFWTTLVNVSFAIMLNELHSTRLKRIYQNAMFLPYFLSIMVVAQLLKTIVFSTEFGLANQILKFLGMEPVAWINTASPWVKILTGTRIWKGTGYGIIIYLSSISGIDESLFEAAALDGAGVWKRIRHIILPLLLPSIFMMMLLSIGSMFYGDFELIYAIQTDNGTVNGLLLKTTDIIETYIFRAVKQSFEFSTSTAIGLYQSVMGFVLVFGSNALVKLYDKDYALF